MILMQFHYTDDIEQKKAMKLLEHLSKKFENTTSLMFVNNLKLNDTFGDLDIQTYAGRDFYIRRDEWAEIQNRSQEFFSKQILSKQYVFTTLWLNMRH